MKKVLTMRYLLGGYRFAKSVNDFEMLEQYWFAIMDELINKPKIYKKFILWRMRLDVRNLIAFKIKNRFTPKMLSDHQ